MERRRSVYLTKLNDEPTHARDESHISRVDTGVEPAIHAEKREYSRQLFTEEARFQ
jgi:hypothetical protein